MYDKPKIELFLHNIQAERTIRQERTSSIRPWSFQWTFPWHLDWPSHWPSDYDFIPTHTETSINDLLSRKEAFGGIIYNPVNRAVYKVNDSGYKLLLYLQEGKSPKDIMQELSITEEEINCFIRYLTKTQL